MSCEDELVLFWITWAKIRWFIIWRGIVSVKYFESSKTALYGRYVKSSVYAYEREHALGNGSKDWVTRIRFFTSDLIKLLSKSMIWSKEYVL